MIQKNGAITNPPDQKRMRGVTTRARNATVFRALRGIIASRKPAYDPENKFRKMERNIARGNSMHIY